MKFLLPLNLYIEIDRKETKLEETWADFCTLFPVIIYELVKYLDYAHFIKYHGRLSLSISLSTLVRSI